MQVPPPPADGVPTDAWVTVAEAARRLGVSTTTIERRIKQGEIPAEKYARPQGSRFLVGMATPSDPLPNGTPHPTPQMTPHQPTPTPRSTPQETTPPVDLTPLVRLVESAQADLVRALEGRASLQAQLAHETIQRAQAEARQQVAEARIADLEAELAGLLAEARYAAERERSRGLGWLRRWWWPAGA